MKVTARAALHAAGPRAKRSLGLLGALRLVERLLAAAATVGLAMRGAVPAAELAALWVCVSAGKAWLRSSTRIACRVNLLQTAVRSLLAGDAAARTD